MENEKRTRGRPKGLPKTGGRTKGTPNKVTRDLRGFLQKLLTENQAQIKRDLKELEPKDRLTILEKFMPYVIPKRTETDITADITDFSRFSDEDLNTIIQNIKI